MGHARLHAARSEWRPVAHRAEDRAAYFGFNHDMTITITAMPHWKRFIPFILASLVAAGGSALAAESMKLTFGSQEFIHRSSKDGQHEFTPASEPDLTTWRRMVTVNVQDKVTNGEQLTELAN